MTPLEMRKKRSITATTPAAKMIQSQVINFLKPCDMTMTVSVSYIRPGDGQVHSTIIGSYDETSLLRQIYHFSPTLSCSIPRLFMLTTKLFRWKFYAV